MERIVVCSDRHSVERACDIFSFHVHSVIACFSSIFSGHPRFFNQLYAGIDYYSLVARFITEALNPSV